PSLRRARSIVPRFRTSPSRRSSPRRPPPTLAAADDDPAPPAAWPLEVAEGATLRTAYRGAQAMPFPYLFWGKNSTWADPVVKGVKTSDGVTTFEIAVDALGLDITGKMTKTGPGEISVEYGVVSKKELSDITGGGLEFNLSLDAPVPGKGNLPVMLADARGFQWDAAGT